MSCRSRSSRFRLRSGAAGLLAGEPLCSRRRRVPLARPASPTSGAAAPRLRPASASRTRPPRGPRRPPPRGPGPRPGLPARPRPVRRGGSEAALRFALGGPGPPGARAPRPRRRLRLGGEGLGDCGRGRRRAVVAGLGRQPRRRGHRRQPLAQLGDHRGSRRSAGPAAVGLGDERHQVGVAAQPGGPMQAIQLALHRPARAFVRLGRVEAAALSAADGQGQTARPMASVASPPSRPSPRGRSPGRRRRQRRSAARRTAPSRAARASSERFLPAKETARRIPDRRAPGRRRRWPPGPPDGRRPPGCSAAATGDRAAPAARSPARSAR